MKLPLELFSNIQNETFDLNCGTIWAVHRRTLCSALGAPRGTEGDLDQVKQQGCVSAGRPNY